MMSKIVLARLTMNGNGKFNDPKIITYLSSKKQLVTIKLVTVVDSSGSSGCTRQGEKCLLADIH